MLQIFLQILQIAFCAAWFNNLFFRVGFGQFNKSTPFSVLLLFSLKWDRQQPHSIGLCIVLVLSERIEHFFFPSTWSESWQDQLNRWMYMNIYIYIWMYHNHSCQMVLKWPCMDVFPSFVESKQLFRPLRHCSKHAENPSRLQVLAGQQMGCFPGIKPEDEVYNIYQATLWGLVMGYNYDEPNPTVCLPTFKNIPRERMAFLRSASKRCDPQHQMGDDGGSSLMVVHG